MEDIASKVEDFSSDEEILGAYDAEWHKMETERVVKLANQEEYEEHKKELEELQKGLEQTKKEVEEIQKELEEGQKELEEGQKELEEGQKELEEGQKELEEQKQAYVKEGLEQGSFNEKNVIALNMLKENIDINIISKVTGLNIEQIKKLESK